MNAQYTSHVQEFLSLKKIAIAGYSSKNDNPANGIYKRLKDNGFEVFAINPKAAAIKDVPCYESISAAPAGLEGVVICTPPAATEKVIEDSARAGIKVAWIHKSIGEGSYSEAAVRKAEELGLKLIPLGCPMMFVKPDIFHKCFRFFMKKKLNA